MSGPNEDKELRDFLELFDAYKTPLHAYVQTITGDHHMAEEITQELFIKLWKRRAKLSEIENIDKYIYRMAHNASMTWFSRLALDARLAREVRARQHTETNNVADQLAYREATALLEEGIAQLSPQRRKVFELSRKEGLKIREIADLLGLSFDTVNHHLTAALAQLRKFFVKRAGERWGVLLLLFKIIQ